jgi:cystathionine gamma-synthase
MQKSKIREDASDTPLIYFRNYSFIIILFISAAMAVVGGGGNDMFNEEGNTPPLEIPCGNPIPLDEHACSVSLPKWSDVVGYEEGNVAVTSKMVCGYPRFVFHPYVVRLMEVVIEMEKQKGDEQGLLSCRAQEDVDCLLLPSYEAACRAHDFLRKAVLLQGTMSTTTTTATASSSYSDNALQHTLTSSCNINDNHHHHLGSILRIRSLQIPSNVHALIFPAETKFAMAAKAYWQHTGEIVSSRRAEAALAELGYSTSSEPSTSTAKEAVACPSGYPCLHPAFLPSSGEPNHTTTTSTTTIHTLLKQRIASITNTCPKSCVYLFPTGMAAIYAALRSARRHGMSLGQPSPKSHLNPQNTTSYTTTLHRYPHCGGGTSIVFGFPYLDTLKLCGRPEICPDGVEFFGHGDTCDLQNLELMLQQRRQKNGLTGSTICALLTEFPSNPLLNCHDLSQLRALADQYNFILIVDDVSSHLIYSFWLEIYIYIYIICN